MSFLERTYIIFFIYLFIFYKSLHCPDWKFSFLSTYAEKKPREPPGYGKKQTSFCVCKSILPTEADLTHFSCRGFLSGIFWAERNVLHTTFPFKQVSTCWGTIHMLFLMPLISKFSTPTDPWEHMITGNLLVLLWVTVFYELVTNS